jgi:hypothetical protein
VREQKKLTQKTKTNADNHKKRLVLAKNIGIQKHQQNTQKKQKGNFYLPTSN